MKKIILILVLLPSIAFAGWDKQDTARQIVFTSLLALDCGQTLNISKNPDKYYEHNPVLGEHPSKESVITYNLSVAVIHALISYYMPEKYREAWQYISIGVEGSSVIRNFNMGIAVTF